jgi:hypothetical protein
MTPHSPLPWRRAQYAGTAGIDDANGSSVADAVTDADAALILRAVNGYSDLLAALEDVPLPSVNGNYHDFLSRFYNWLNHQRKPAIARAEEAP